MVCGRGRQQAIRHRTSGRLPEVLRSVRTQSSWDTASVTRAPRRDSRLGQHLVLPEHAVDVGQYVVDVHTFERRRTGLSCPVRFHKQNPWRSSGRRGFLPLEECQSGRMGIPAKDVAGVSRSMGSNPISSANVRSDSTIGVFSP